MIETKGVVRRHGLEPEIKIIQNIDYVSIFTGGLFADRFEKYIYILQYYPIGLHSIELIHLFHAPPLYKRMLAKNITCSF